jgi:sarcosine oxidase subunit alpha
MSDVIFRVDGSTLRAAAGTTVAAALVSAGISGFRTSVTGEPRGPLCGMGTCHECRLTIDGVPHRRACMVVVASGMEVTTRA